MDDEAIGQDQPNERAAPTSGRPARRRVTEDERPPWLGIALGAAIIAAPFLALLYGIEAGLLVMTIALAAVGLLAVFAARSAEPDLRQRLLLVAAVNLVLALVCLIVLLARS